jgi:hypothetical protein
MRNPAGELSGTVVSAFAGLIDVRTPGRGEPGLCSETDEFSFFQGGFPSAHGDLNLISSYNPPDGRTQIMQISASTYCNLYHSLCLYSTIWY